MHDWVGHEVYPLIGHPSDLRKILLDVKDEICSQPRLALPGNKDVNIWAYYSHIRDSPIVMEDFLIVILSNPSLIGLYKWTSIELIICLLSTLSLRLVS